MTTRVHGGFLPAVMIDGSLTHFHIHVAGTFAGYVDGNGYPVPYSAAEKVYNTVAQKATPVIININAGDIYMALENTAEGWTAATLQTALQALGASVGVDAVDLSAATVANTGYVLTP